MFGTISFEDVPRPTLWKRLLQRLRPERCVRLFRGFGGRAVHVVVACYPGMPGRTRRRRIGQGLKALAGAGATELVTSSDFAETDLPPRYGLQKPAETLFYRKECGKLLRFAVEQTGADSVAVIGRRASARLTAAVREVAAVAGRLTVICQQGAEQLADLLRRDLGVSVMVSRGALREAEVLLVLSWPDCLEESALPSDALVICLEGCPRDFSRLADGCLLAPPPELAAEGMDDHAMAMALYNAGIGQGSGPVITALTRRGKKLDAGTA